MSIMKRQTDWEGKVWETGSHKWVPVFPYATHVKCVHCSRIVPKEDIRRGGMTKCNRQIKYVYEK